MNKDPIISIITPYYNAQEYIEETAKSVLNQTFPYFEWIIVDDGSSEEAKEKLKQISKLDKRIKIYFDYFNGEKIEKMTQKGPSLLGQKGPAQARDFGIKNSAESTKYIVFLDADDLYDKTFLECSYWTLETHPEASWTYTDSVNFGAKNFLWRKWYDVEWEMKENILTVSACVRKKDLLEVNGFGVKEKRVYEDWYLWLKLIKAGKYPVRMSSLLTYYRQKEEMSELKESNNNNREKALKIVKEITKEITKYNEGIQFPKYDYDWEEIKDENGNIVDIKTEKSKKINVLMIIPWMITGGADRFNLDLVSKMDNDKFEFTIITTLPAKNEWRKNFEKYATVYDLTTFLNMKDWISFINYIIKKNNINIIFNSNSQFGYEILPYLKAKYSQIPIIDYVHMEEWYWRNGGFARNSAINQNVIDRTFTCNENSRNVFIKRFKRKKPEVKTIYIGVDEKKFDPDKFDKKEILKELNETKLNSKKYVISYICRISEQKRPFLFFKVIKKLSEIRNDFVVIVAGEGSMLLELKNMVKKEQLDDFFVFLGNIKDTEKVLKISDLTINTSIKEGIALSSFESLAMGVPVVSSDVGGQSELITEDVGVIVPCIQREKDVLDFNYSNEEINNYVEAIEKVLNNLVYYKENCRNRILNSFTIDKMIENMKKEFIMITNNPSKDKIQNGIELSKNMDILKELISTYIVSSKPEYEWLSNEFNKNNIHKIKANKKSYNYEKTIEYKIKHPIVVVLRKIGIYENLKSVIYKN